MKRLKFLFALLLAAVIISPAAAQDSSSDGRGVVRFAVDASYGRTYGEELFAQTCDQPMCRLLQPLLYARLFDTNAATGALRDASASENALVTISAASLPADDVTLTVRQDRTWSDGEPITAYDVLFSLMAFTEIPQSDYSYLLNEIVGLRLIDAQTLAIRFQATDAEIEALPPDAEPPTATCDDLPRANVYILPAHEIAPQFQAFVDDSAPQGESLMAWWQSYRASRGASLAALPDVVVTGGAYDWGGLGGKDDARFLPADGTGAVLRRVQVAPTNTSRPAGVNAFIAGETNLLLDVPISQRAEIRALADPNVRGVQVAEPPGRAALIIILNLGGTRRPLPGIHPETGELVEQETSLYFGDVRVRRALQLAMDQDALIDGVLQRSADPLSGLLPPSSWADDSAAPPMESNLAAARQLLDEAGWRDANNDGTRECVSCSTALVDTPFYIQLGSYSENYALAQRIAARWRLLGVSASVADTGSFDPAQQTFDAVLLSVGGQPYLDADPDRHLMLTPVGDRVPPRLSSFPLNYGSYHNPAVTALVEQARTLPGCDPAARAEIYHQIDAILRDDLPFLYVAAPREFYAAAPGVIGFAPRTGDPFWNVESWVVTP